jgi:hypothetical protein
MQVDWEPSRNNPAEANSVKEMTAAGEVFRNRGVRLEEVAIAGSNHDAPWPDHPRFSRQPKNGACDQVIFWPASKRCAARNNWTKAQPRC